MKALSLWQPWASLVAMGVKTIETRSWSTSYRGPLAIHAATYRGPKVCYPNRDVLVLGRYDYDRRTAALVTGDGDHDPIGRLVGRLPLGAVVATCTLVDVVPMVDRWSHGKLIEPTKPCLTIEPSHLLLATPSAIPVWKEMEHERPYGDYRPGRYAWVLGNISAIERVPARGHQRLFEWDDPDWESPRDREATW